MQTVREILKIPSRFRNEREVGDLISSESMRELADKVPSDEKVMRIVQGIHNNSIGVLAATDKRVLFVGSGSVGRHTLFDIPYDDIIAAVSVPKLFMSKVTIQHSDGELVIGKVSRRHAQRIAVFIDKAASTARASFIQGAVK